MKKKMLNVKIILTNFSRIIMSFLFINLNFSFFDKVFGVTGPSPEDPAVTCYSAGMPDPHPIVVMGRVFILLVPIAIIIGIIIFVIKRKKKKDGPKEEKIDDKQN